MSLAKVIGKGIKTIVRWSWDAYIRETTTAHNLPERTSRKDIDAMTGTQFEHFIANLLRREKYYAQVVGGANDLAADIIGCSREGKKIVVQCKRYSATKKVSSKEMQLFVGMAFLEHKADMAIYVTSSLYTQQALELGRKHNIICIDRLTLEKWLDGRVPSALSQI